MSTSYTAKTALEPARKDSKPFLIRYARIRGYGLLGLLLVTLALLAGMIWRNQAHFETVRSYVGYSHRILQVSLDLQQILTDYFRATTGHPDPAQVTRLSAELETLAREDHHLDPATPARLHQMLELVLSAHRNPNRETGETALLQALNVASAMLDAETIRREHLLEEISRLTHLEIALAAGTLLTLLIFTALFLKRRILAPLQDLKELLLRLAREDFTPIGTAHLDPLLLPVFQSYNEMVTHLAELEEAKRHYAETLQGEVRSATQALLEQQASLARAERLAAVGELTASIAHELRNPLAGIQLSCANLRDEIRDPDQAERLDLVISELKRMGRLLHELLEQGRHAPAPITDCPVAAVMRELVALARYQIPSCIELSVDAPPDLVLRLPESRLRQTLLNLILNAAHALDGNAGTIRLRAESDADSVILTVTDDGPGFTPEILAGEGIRPFSTGRPDGTGLGLAMVQRFVREVGGRLKLGNVWPHGASVTLILPRQA